MDVTILKLHELTPEQVVEAGTFLHEEVRTNLSDWVCQAALATRLTIWDDSYPTRLEAQAALLEEALNSDRWYAIVNDVIVGVCGVSRGKPDRTITLFLIDLSLSSAEQLEIADALALSAINDILADLFGKGNFVSCFPDGSPAAVYAKLCGFRVVEAGPVVTEWEIGVEELRDNILARLE